VNTIAARMTTTMLPSRTQVRLRGGLTSFTSPPQRLGSHKTLARSLCVGGEKPQFGGENASQTRL
jgi:hypothetical protein